MSICDVSNLFIYVQFIYSLQSPYAYACALRNVHYSYGTPCELITACHDVTSLSFERNVNLDHVKNRNH